MEAFHLHPEQPTYIVRVPVFFEMIKRSGMMDVRQDADNVQISDLPLEVVDLREHIVSRSTDGDGSVASSSRHGAVALLSEDPLEAFIYRRSLSRYRHSETGHDGEGGEEVVARTTRLGGHDERIAEPATPKQQTPTLPPSRIPAQHSNVSHKFKLPSVNENDGLALFSLQSEVSELTEPRHFEMSHLLPRRRRTLSQKYLRALICFTVPLNPSCMANNQISGIKRITFYAQHTQPGPLSSDFDI